MQSIVHKITHDTRHSFDLNARLSETPNGVVLWSPTQDKVLTLRANETTRASVEPEGLRGFRIDGVRKRIQEADVSRMADEVDGFVTSETFYDRDVGTLHKAIEIVQAVVDGQSYVITADFGTGALSTFEVTSTGGWAARQTIHDDAATALNGVSAMASATIGDAAFIVTASGTENAVSVLGLGAGGALTALSALSAADGLPIAAPSDIQIVDGAGGTFVVLASAGSDSLTALRINGQGGLTFVDQIIDSRDTRFDATVAMDWVTRDGRIFGAVAGADGGVSIIELLPTGRFVVHFNVEDSTETGLSGITDVLLRVTATGLDLTTVSAAEESLSRFEIAVSGGIVEASGGAATGRSLDEVLLGSSGDDVLRGNGGADVLIDGAGDDSLHGGDGADLFVLDADGTIDRILDFDIRYDRLDLSAWGMLYSVDQLQVQGRSYGALISFGAEVLQIVTHNGRRLSAADFTDAMILGAHHATVWEELSDGITADPGVEVLGSAVADVLIGGTGDDTIMAKGGDDIIIATVGDDVIDGGSGRDILTAVDADQAMTLSLGGTVSGVEDLRGSAYADVLLGNSGANNDHRAGPVPDTDAGGSATRSAG